ncbi:hypothetical protein EDD17DRAFT_1557674 [Pisolithus thermaeus]|nr:hypothetical protein EDD17DRAFT_1557674 [Pisolithus thermaeus]
MLALKGLPSAGSAAQPFTARPPPMSSRLPMGVLLALLLSLSLSSSAVANSLGLRDNEHMHHGQPLTEINETDILLSHLPTPPSYWSIDIDSPDPDVSRYPGLMALHVTFMMLAFFVVLPAGIALRSLKHRWHAFTVVLFYFLCALGCAASALYRKLTPDMYDGSTHSSHGYVVICLTLVPSALDIVAFFARLYAYLRGDDKFTFKSLWRTVVLGREPYDLSSDYTGLVAEDPEEYDEIKPFNTASQGASRLHSNSPSADGKTADLERYTTSWVNEASPHATHRSTLSAASDRTLFDPRHSEETLRDAFPPPTSRPSKSLVQRVTAIVRATLERSLVFAAFGLTLTGIVVYTGGCRNNYINGCLAHLIKGGIFWCYGLFSFARFLGSHSEMGWAWNISPIGNHISAELVESTVIFLYGISNTWMERFGAHPGDPFTTKQVQHISIAVMFWFAGLVGMGMESRHVRKWLAASASSALGPAPSSTISEPPSYRGSFNPFPALVIGVTGAAMSAHAQTYLFQVGSSFARATNGSKLFAQVQIHQLWGWLLLGFSVMRCLTYFFLWLDPPKSVLPSRPPTEALGSFFLACGGLMFMFSTEEVTLGAMRRGRDDMMMFLNVAVAITCFAFCWTLCVVGFKGWLKYRGSHPTLTSS